MDKANTINFTIDVNNVLSFCIHKRQVSKVSHVTFNAQILTIYWAKLQIYVMNGSRFYPKSFYFFNYLFIKVKSGPMMGQNSWFSQKLQTWHDTKEKSIKYRCMYVNDQVMQFCTTYIHVLMYTIKCKISFYEIYIICLNILGAGDLTGIVRSSTWAFSYILIELSF